MTGRSASVIGSSAASSARNWRPKGWPVSKRASMCNCERARKSASSAVSATTALTTMNAFGSASCREGRNALRYAARARSVPCPAKWCAKTKGLPGRAAGSAE